MICAAQPAGKAKSWGRELAGAGGHPAHQECADRPL